jgi:hypothetical protein
MKVFSNYNPNMAGGVVANSHPVVQVYPWIPNKQTSPSTPHRLVTPTERGNPFLRSNAGAPKPKVKGGCGCNSTALEGGHS